MVEDNVTFLGQGWFRSAWKVDGMGVYDEEELERGYAYGEDDDGEGIEGVTFDEPVVLKTLRFVRVLVRMCVFIVGKYVILLEEFCSSSFLCHSFNCP